MTADREAFVENNLGLAHACARRYAGRGIDYDDLFQAGCLGLVKSAESFDESRGLRFSTYAVPVILGEIRRLFRDGGAVKVSRSLKELGMKAGKISDEFCREHGRQPLLSELAQRLGVPAETAAEAVCAVQTPISLTVQDDDGDQQLELPSESFDNGLIDVIALRQAMLTLDSTDRSIIRKRYYGRSTQTKTAASLGMTQVQVSRREKKIISALRRELCD